MASTTAANKISSHYHPLPSLLPSKLSLASLGGRAPSESEEIEEFVQEIGDWEAPELERIVERLDRMMARKALGSCLGAFKFASRNCGENGVDKKYESSMTTTTGGNGEKLENVEIVKLEMLAEMAALKASLLKEIAKSRAREDQLRIDLAAAKLLQEKSTMYESHTSSRGCQTASTTKVVNPNGFANLTNMNSQTLLVQLGKSKDEQPLSSFCSLRNLAREQVIKSVGERNLGFLKEVKSKNPNGLFQWENALDWLDHHPTIVDSLGLSMHNLRQT